jgi:arylsulfatase A-like enzyme
MWRFTRKHGITTTITDAEHTTGERRDSIAPMRSGCRWSWTWHAAAVLALAAALSAAGCGRSEPKISVLVILIDTLRADHLHSMGHPLELSPEIDALAATGWVFENHVAHASQTVPSTLSLLLSQLPAEHGVVHRDVQQFAKERPHYPDSFVFLAEVLRDAGYATAGFVANPYLGSENGFDQGFETFRSSGDDGGEITGGARDWLRAWSADRTRPFFLYLHYMDVHQPYRAAELHANPFVPAAGGVKVLGNRRIGFPNPSDVAYTKQMYAACVPHVDAQVGTILAELAALGVRDDTLVVLTSDHGEEFGEHGGIGHGTTVYGELLRVPLILSHPRLLAPPRRIAHVSRHLDVAPTLLRLIGVDAPDTFRGGSLLEPAPDAIAENGPWRAIHRDRWKLVWNIDTGEEQLFELRDALDRRPIDDPRAAALLAESLRDYVALDAAREPPATGAAPDWTDEEKERLRSLGYAQ